MCVSDTFLCAMTAFLKKSGSASQSGALLLTHSFLGRSDPVGHTMKKYGAALGRLAVPWSTTAGVGTFFSVPCISHGKLSERERAGVEGHSSGSSRSASYSPKGLWGFAQSPESDLICQSNNFTENCRCRCSSSDSSRESPVCNSARVMRMAGLSVSSFPATKLKRIKDFPLV